MSNIRAFVRESNWIEGIRRDPTGREIEAHELFLTEPLSVALVERFVAMVQPGAVLRDRVGLDVRVGDHIAPLGGPEIRDRLFNLLDSVDTPNPDPYVVHRRYESLDPFTDGNGRSGRALWLRMMGGPARVQLGFLHHFYYQCLAAGDGR